MDETIEMEGRDCHGGEHHVYRVAMIADTMIRSKEKELPQGIIDKLEGVDLIIHSGNACIEKVIERLEEIAPVRACLGNCDDKRDFSRPMNREEVFEFGGIKFGIQGYMPEPGVFEGKDIDVVVWSGTGIPKIEESPHIGLIINPGSVFPEYSRKTTHGTMVLLKFDNEVRFTYLVKV